VRTNIEIVGVVRDFSYRDLREQTEQAFVPFFEGDWTAGTFYLRVRGTPQAAFGLDPVGRRPRGSDVASAVAAYVG
jgi:hypothetical protein